MESVRSAKWCPSRHTLAICTGNHHVYLWSPEVRELCLISIQAVRYICTVVVGIYLWLRVDVTKLDYAPGSVSLLSKAPNTGCHYSDLAYFFGCEGLQK